MTRRKDNGTLEKPPKKGCDWEAVGGTLRPLLAAKSPGAEDLPLFPIVKVDRGDLRRTRKCDYMGRIRGLVPTSPKSVTNIRDSPDRTRRKLMTKTLRPAAIAAILLTTLVCAAEAAVISTWTFEPQPFTDLSNSSVGPTVTATTGPGSATGFHALATTDWSTPAGNGTTDSFSSNDWSVGDYYEFTTDTTGYEDIIVSWDQTRSSTGPGTFDFYYSSTGSAGPYTLALDNYTVLANTTAAGPPATAPWSSMTPRQSVYTFTVDLSAITALDGNSSVAIRLVGDVAAAAGGTNRVDNFQVDGTLVPEPTWLAVCGMMVLMISARRRA